MSIFSLAEKQYYARQFALKGVGLAGQEKIKRARVSVVGAGGLGCPVLLYLTGAGVGTLGIVDDDTVAMHNLHRQVLYGTEDVGNNKATTAAGVLAQHNAATTFNTFPMRLTAENASALLSGYDLVVDGSDNFETRYTVNDACVALNIPLVSGAVYQFEGQVGVFNYRGSGDYRKLFPIPPSNDDFNCEITGILGSTCAIIAGHMTTEVVKILLGLPGVLSDKLLQLNLLGFSYDILNY